MLWQVMRTAISGLRGRAFVTDSPTYSYAATTAPAVSAHRPQAVVVRTFVVQDFKIPTGSMEQNLLIGDHLLVNKFIYAPSATALERAVLPIANINRGDVVVF